MCSFGIFPSTDNGQCCTQGWIGFAPCQCRTSNPGRVLARVGGLNGAQFPALPSRPGGSGAPRVGRSGPTAPARTSPHLSGRGGGPPLHLRQSGAGDPRLRSRASWSPGQVSMTHSAGVRGPNGIPDGSLEWGHSHLLARTQPLSPHQDVGLPYPSVTH